MDKKSLLQDEVQAFIKDHEGSDLPSLMLHRDKYAHLPLRQIIEQITSRQKAEKKLPLWYKTAGILYPPPLSIEQSSSEIAAKYKASLFSGKLALDLTGGFGVDSFYLAKEFDQLTYVEANANLAEVAQHNFMRLQQNNITVESLSAEKFLSETNEKFDLVYIDPDRRPDNKRVVGFDACEPNLPALLPEIEEISSDILIKSSPMLDISLGLSQLKNVKMVIVLAIENEVKELLFWLNSKYSEELKIKCVNLDKKGDQILEYCAIEAQEESCSFDNISTYLYEPNASIMKAGAYNLLCKRYRIKKLHHNTHLYTSSVLITDFPGRKFLVKGVKAYNKNKILPLLTSPKANISVRNFTDTPDQVKKKLGLGDGGEQYLFGYRDVNEQVRVAVCTKV